ncbi:OmpP1/FadL family transporter [Comamonas aquatica]|uniref:OmpP1/FadL family transporter n=1 Tax=Comamonas aquatica TaxID=225991 RepID=UPI001FD3F345|nr:outer membrane protein transport protein [Comamonas aquatica]
MSPSVNALRMKPAGMACATLALSTCALAGGVDRTSHSLSPLFEKGAHLSVEAYASRPQIQGTDAWGQSTGQVAPRFAQWGFAYKQDVDARNSVLVMLTRPYGLDIDYDRQSSRLFGGTQARISTYELMGALRHRWTERWAVHGGLRVQRSEGHVALNGLAFGPLNGYRVDFAPSTRPGYLLGLSYERPEIGLRIAGTYYSAIKHHVTTRENLRAGTTTTESNSPQSFTLDLQTGLTPSTLVFGQIRWSQWSQFQLSPQAFAAATQGRSLTDLDDATTYTLGLAQKLGPQWSGFVALGYDPKSGKTPLSPLRPSSGRMGYTLGLSYQHERVKITPWISYQRLGATDVSSTRTPMAHFGQSSATAVGVKLGYSFE